MRDLPRLWHELGERVLQIVAEDIPVNDANVAMCAVVEEHGDVLCELQLSGRLTSSSAFERAAASMPWSVQTLLGTGGESSTPRLFLAGQEPLPPEDLARIARVFERMLRFTAPVSPYGRVIHRANNMLASLLANLDYVDVLLAQESEDAPILAQSTAHERKDFFLALSHARTAATRLCDALRGETANTGNKSEG